MTSVLVDARELGGESSASGVGTFIRGLLEGLAARDDVDVRALATREIELPASVTPVPIRRLARTGGRRAVLEHEVLLPFDLLRDRAAVFHNPLFHPPWRVGRPWVQTLYDVIPLVYPDPNLDVLRRRWRRFAPRYRRADAIVAISRHAADEGIRHLGLDARRVEVAHLGVHPRFHPASEAGHDGEPYLLVVSEYSRRKGFADAFAVAARLADAGLPHRLKVVGRVPPHVAGELEQLVRSAPRPDRIDLLGFVPDLAAVYRHADLVLVPSRYEGFGLPALEAMASGAPVIAYDNSSLPEVVRDGGLLVPDGDVDALAAAARSVLTEASLRAELRERGPAHAAGFTWEATAAAYAAVYERVAAA
jgi:glycosyltransferase involved in cell wall biosynthesis